MSNAQMPDEEELEEARQLIVAARAWLAQDTASRFVESWVAQADRWLTAHPEPLSDNTSNDDGVPYYDPERIK